MERHLHKKVFDEQNSENQTNWAIKLIIKVLKYLRLSWRIGLFSKGILYPKNLAQHKLSFMLSNSRQTTKFREIYIKNS